MTEDQETSPATPRHGWLLYDGECRFCTDLADRFARWGARREVALVPLQSPWAQRQLGQDPDELPNEMVLLTRDHRTYSGADALLHLADLRPLTRPLAVIGRFGLVHPLLVRIYRWIAMRRHCLGGRCELRRRSEPSHPHITDWLPVIVLPFLVVAGMNHLPPWGLMWCLALAIFASAKWLTWRDAGRRGVHAHPLRTLGYLLAWPGMNAMDFLRSDRRVNIPDTREWVAAAAKVIAGGIIVWGIVRILPNESELLIGWVGMIGLILLLHFGTFELVSLTWRANGVVAPPIMQRPLAAPSIGAFWNRRWNTAFHELAHRYVFRPGVHLGGTVFAVLLVFGVSGLVHDLIISLPASRGFGLPTAYFLLQGITVLAERTPIARRWGLGRGFRGWLLTVIVTAVPIGLLFHPAFVREVILPFLRVIGAR